MAPPASLPSCGSALKASTGLMAPHGMCPWANMATSKMSSTMISAIRPTPSTMLDSRTSKKVRIEMITTIARASHGQLM